MAKRSALNMTFIGPEVEALHSALSDYVERNPDDQDAQGNLDQLEQRLEGLR